MLHIKEKPEWLTDRQFDRLKLISSNWGCGAYGSGDDMGHIAVGFLLDVVQTFHEFYRAVKEQTAPESVPLLVPGGGEGGQISDEEITLEVYQCAVVMLQMEELKDKGLVGGGPECNRPALTRVVEIGERKGYPNPELHEYPAILASLDGLPPARSA